MAEDVGRGPGGPAPPAVEPPCGAAVPLPVDDELDEVGALAEDVLFVDVTEVAACVGAGLVQLGLGSCVALGGSAPPELELLLALGDAEAVAVGVLLGLTLGLTLGLGLGLGLTLGLTLGLGLGLGLTLAEALGLGLELTVLLLPPVALADVAGAVGLLVALLDELVLVTV